MAVHFEDNWIPSFLSVVYSIVDSEGCGAFVFLEFACYNLSELRCNPNVLFEAHTGRPNMCLLLGEGLPKWLWVYQKQIKSKSAS